MQYNEQWLETKTKLIWNNLAIFGHWYGINDDNNDDINENENENENENDNDNDNSNDIDIDIDIDNEISWITYTVKNENILWL